MKCFNSIPELFGLKKFVLYDFSIGDYEDFDTLEDLLLAGSERFKAYMEIDQVISNCDNFLSFNSYIYYLDGFCILQLDSKIL